MNKLALYCRIGFEKEVAAEITDRASERGVFGFARVVENSGYVIFECYQPGDADRLAQEIPFNRLIFARQMIVVSDFLENLDPQDRISPILAQYKRIAEDINLKQAVELFVETADTNEAKELSTFCRKFTVPLRQALKKQGWLQGKPNAKRGQILHCFFIGNFKLKMVSRHQPLINHFPIKFAIRLGCSTMSHTSQSICLRFGGWNLNPSSGQCSILPVSCKLAAILP
jgi:23S rRNA C2498 (ribose-2'-O)-methylase RlmM